MVTMLIFYNNVYIQYLNVTCLKGIDLELLIVYKNYSRRKNNCRKVYPAHSMITSAVVICAAVIFVRRIIALLSISKIPTSGSRVYGSIIYTISNFPQRGFIRHNRFHTFKFKFVRNRGSKGTVPRIASNSLKQLVHLWTKLGFTSSNSHNKIILG